MTRLKGVLLIAFWMLIVFPNTMIAQQSEKKNTSISEMKIAAREIMKASETCAFITLDESSLPMVRIMEPFRPEEDFTVWFGTNAQSRKVNQIKNNPNVTLYYQDSDDTGYVVIHGKAQIIDDPNEKEQRWMDHWEAFYPNDRQDYLLIKVAPNWMEILSVSRNILGDSITWKTPVIKFD